jgi:signal transduction histidine kinase
MSIKAKLLLISILFVSIPTILMGLIAYFLFEREAFRQTENELSYIAQDWKITAYSYLQQEERVLSREKSLVGQKLTALAKDFYLELDSVRENFPPTALPKWREGFKKRILKIRLGKSGNAILIDGSGNYLARAPEIYGGNNFFKNYEQINPGTAQELWSRIKKLNPEETLLMEYNWRRPADPSDKKTLTAFIYYAPFNYIIGVSNFFTDFQSTDLRKRLLDELRYKIADLKIGETGYVWAINGAGEYIVSRNHLRDGEKILDLTDRQGRKFIVDIIKTGREKGSNYIQKVYYSWRDFDEGPWADKLAAVSYIPEWDIFICAGTYINEILKGPNKVRQYLVIICSLAITIGSMVAYLVTWSLATPIFDLKNRALLAAQGDLNQDINHLTARRDELGTLAKAFATMMENLKTKIGELVIEIDERKKIQAEREVLNQKLVETSRYAGMAEVATGVLHNVGNVLNSINVSTSCLQDQIDHLKLESLSRAMELLRQHQGDLKEYLTNNEQGKVFIPFMEKLNESLLTLKQKIREELQSLQTNVEHVKEIVAAQQSYARQIAMEDNFSVTQVIEDALRINLAGLLRHKIDVTKDFQVHHEMIGDRQKLLQILVNIISNAKYAMDGKDTRKLVIRTCLKDNSLVQIRIIDSGKGIEPDNLTKIFQHGFTTRKDGHGFGLHSSALSAKQLGGSLWAESDGPGKGATFVIELPRSSKESFSMKFQS